MLKNNLLYLLTTLVLAVDADEKLLGQDPNLEIKSAENPQQLGVNVPSIPSPYLSFLIIGNWGNPRNVGSLTKIAEQMNNVASKSNPTAVITTGNNFYGPLNGLDDPLWRTSWTNVFTGRVGTLPFWASMGNNEWSGIDYRTELNYMQKSPRWVLPDIQYERIVTKNGLKVAIVVVDTSLLYYDYVGDSPAMAANFQKAQLTQQDQGVLKKLKWIDDTLSKHQDKDYLVVVGHHFLKTCAYTNVTNMNNLNALFQKWKISAYVFGHNSALQSVQDSGIAYIQVASTGDIQPICKGSNGWTKGNAKI